LGDNFSFYKSDQINILNSKDLFEDREFNKINKIIEKN